MKYRVGDRVVVKNKRLYNYNKIPLKGEIVEIVEEGEYCDVPYCSVKDSEGYTFFYNEYEMDRTWIVLFNWDKELDNLKEVQDDR